MPAIVDKNKCENNGDCIAACPSDAIVLENEKALVDPEKCCDCHACVDSCVAKAISII